MRLRPLILTTILAAALAAVPLTACQTQRSVLIHADGQSRLVTVARAETVGDALAEAGVALGAKDRVTPDIYARLSRSSTITVVRVTERTETATEDLPFEREIVRDEARPRGETRVLQAGASGLAEISYLITLEDGIAVSHEQVSRRIVRPPVNEVVQVGTMGSLPPVPINGTLAYLSGGNAWVIRGNSADKRPVTFRGDLDGRVFALSANGHELAFTRRPETGTAGLNALWSLNTLQVDDAAQPQHQVDVLAAGWRGESLIFTTGQATPGPPGWKAFNDLWMLPSTGRLRQSLPPMAPPGAYGWWGSELAVSPDGRMLAYGGADSVGVLDLETGQNRTLARFAPLRTQADWVWTAGLAWSPNSGALAAVVHGRPVGSEAAEDSPAFDLWLLPADGSPGRVLASAVGMWALPVWSPTGENLAYGAAREPRGSAVSAYDPVIMRLADRATSEPLAQAGWPGLEPQRPAWSPDGRQLVVEHLGDLYLVGVDGGQPRALTDDGRSSQPQWR